MSRGVGLEGLKGMRPFLGVLHVAGLGCASASRDKLTPVSEKGPYTLTHPDQQKRTDLRETNRTNGQHVVTIGNLGGLFAKQLMGEVCQAEMPCRAEMPLEAAVLGSPCWAGTTRDADPDPLADQAAARQLPCARSR